VADKDAVSIAAGPTAGGAQLVCVFFRSETGNEPVREWLRGDISAEARKTIGADIRTVQATWPIGKPLVDSLGDGLREIRSTHEKVEFRVIFIVDQGVMVLLHGYKKKSQKTKKADIDVARERRALRERSK
jgi:phage-related protein